MQRFLKHLGSAIFLGILIYGVFIGFYYFNGNFKTGFDFTFLWRNFYSNMLYAVTLYMINAYWLQHLVLKYDYQLFRAKRFIIALLGNMILSLAGIFLVRFFLSVVLHQEEFVDFISKERFSNYRILLIITLAVSCVFYAFWYYKHRQETRVKEQKIIAGTASAKFDALKNQLDPHFLFNSLNVLTSLIEEDPHQAQKFTTSLSKVYRYVLEQKNKDLVSVDEEMQFARTYVRLLKMRFEDSIIFEIPKESRNPNAKIVPLSLQLLLENAVKHNVVTSSKPLHIKVFEVEDTLVVSNNLQEKQVVKKSSGVGLKNIQERYAILSEREVSINRTAKEFIVALPMLTKQISIMETQQNYITDKRYEKAKERVEAIKGFYSNLTAYCFVIPFLIFINYNTTSFPWSIFPALGWGIGIVAHGMQAYGYNPILGNNWEERKMREYMDDENF